MMAQRIRDGVQKNSGQKLAAAPVQEAAPAPSDERKVMNSAEMQRFFTGR
jgi:hypothetical protein